MKSLFAFLFLLSISNSAQARPCREIDLAVLRSYELNAIKYAEYFSSELLAASIKYPRKAHLFSLSEKILSCAMDRLEAGFDYDCAATKNGAETLPFIGNTILLNEFYFYYPTLFQIGVLLHEATHKCGTNDAHYLLHGEEPIAPHNAWYCSWANVASTYDYWVIKGFCLPEIDCDTKPETSFMPVSGM
jgi:hypothetical protein